MGFAPKVRGFLRKTLLTPARFLGFTRPIDSPLPPQTIQERREYIELLKTLVGEDSAIGETTLESFDTNPEWITITARNASFPPDEGPVAVAERVTGPILFPAIGPALKPVFFGMGDQLIFNDFHFRILGNKVVYPGNPDVLGSFLARHALFDQARLQTIEHKRKGPLEWISYELRLLSGRRLKLTFLAGDVMTMNLADLGESSLGMVYSTNMGWRGTLGDNGTFWLKMWEMLSTQGIVFAENQSPLFAAADDPSLPLAFRRTDASSPVYKVNKAMTLSAQTDYAAQAEGPILAYLRTPEALAKILRLRVPLDFISSCYLLTSANLERLNKRLRRSRSADEEAGLFALIQSLGRGLQTETTPEEKRVLRSLIALEERVLENMAPPRWRWLRSVFSLIGLALMVGGMFFLISHPITALTLLCSLVFVIGNVWQNRSGTTLRSAQSDRLVQALERSGLHKPIIREARAKIEAGSIENVDGIHQLLVGRFHWSEVLASRAVINLESTLSAMEQSPNSDKPSTEPLLATAHPENESRAEVQSVSQVTTIEMPDAPPHAPSAINERRRPLLQALRDFGVERGILPIHFWYFQKASLPPGSPAPAMIGRYLRNNGLPVTPTLVKQYQTFLGEQLLFVRDTEGFAELNKLRIAGSVSQRRRQHKSRDSAGDNGHHRDAPMNDRPPLSGYRSVPAQAMSMATRSLAVTAPLAGRLSLPFLPALNLEPLIDTLNTSDAEAVTLPRVGDIVRIGPIEYHIETAGSDINGKPLLSLMELHGFFVRELDETEIDSLIPLKDDADGLHVYLLPDLAPANEMPSLRAPIRNGFMRLDSDDLWAMIQGSDPISEGIRELLDRSDLSSDRLHELVKSFKIPIMNSLASLGCLLRDLARLERLTSSPARWGAGTTKYVWGLRRALEAGA